MFFSHHTHQPLEMSLIIKNLENLIFVVKNQRNDQIIGCKFPYGLVQFIEMDDIFKKSYNNLKVNLSEMKFEIKKS